MGGRGSGRAESRHKGSKDRGEGMGRGQTIERQGWSWKTIRGPAGRAPARAGCQEATLRNELKLSSEWDRGRRDLYRFISMGEK
jgi:hypothetical protein